MGKEVTFIGPTSPVMRVLGDETGSNLVPPPRPPNPNPDSLTLTA